MATHKVWFKVALSNGAIFIENKNIFDTPEATAWAKLDKHIVENNLQIKSLSLIVEDKTIFGKTSQREFTVPSSANRPNFKAFFSAEKPLDYNVCRKMRGVIRGNDISKVQEAAKNMKADELYTVAEAIYPEYRLQIWVSENDTRKCYVLTERNN